MLVLLYILLTSQVNYVWHPSDRAGWCGKEIYVNVRIDHKRDQVLLHEAGHSLGLGHCKKSCLMYKELPLIFDRKLCKDCEYDVSKMFNSIDAG